ncbi:2-polyprenyl-6-methoxyphenol hydroxylase-like FAD-dependent oxidoreductase [Streptomyces tendae]|uniref:FAD-dependent monooxygenase n=1 Tax=Streptomyces tendae TaxID=1932 RepID=UPI003833C9E3
MKEIGSTVGRRALVVGLGISGISVALRLSQAGWIPVIVEKHAGRRSGGYFVGLFGTGRAAAERLGILKSMTDRAAPKSVTLDLDRMGNGKPGLGFTDLPGRPWIMLRGDAERAAYAALPEHIEIRFSTVPTAIEQRADAVEVTLTNSLDGTNAIESFDLVVGADGLRSTVRSLAFGPHKQHLKRLNHMIAAFQLAEPLDGIAPQDGATLMEPGRSMWLFPFADQAPTALFSYRTDDVDAEFSEPPAQRIRRVFGSRPLGPILRQAIDELENADEILFDSVEQVNLDSWHDRRVVLIGDAAWCPTLYSGMGLSAALSGAELLGTELERHPEDLELALTSWEKQIRPYMDYYQEIGLRQKAFFTPATYLQILRRRMFIRLQALPIIGKSLLNRRVTGKDGRMKEVDIAAA